MSWRRQPVRRSYTNDLTAGVVLGLTKALAQANDRIVELEKENARLRAQTSWRAWSDR